MLTELDKAVLFTIYKRANKSKKAHFPIEFICKGFPTHQHGFIKRSVEKLRKRGLLYVKPHPSGRSYGLTDEGWELARKLEEEYRIR
ncbi:MAG: hypothetical protein J7K36_04745 [Archaeoglobaceae archaeon]|nr:hypothetical protein [Archaeoglobaceae archaeon]